MASGLPLAGLLLVSSICFGASSLFAGEQSGPNAVQSDAYIRMGRSINEGPFQQSGPYFKEGVYEQSGPHMQSGPQSMEEPIQHSGIYSESGTHAKRKMPMMSATDPPKMMHRSHNGCPRQWTAYGSRCFRFFYRRKTWINAEDYCIREGGNLASIHSRGESDFVNDLAHGRRAWVGATDAVREGRWMWSDGSNFGYTNWAKGQPKKRRRRQDCVEINFRGSGWNDEPCRKRKPFVCAIRN